jgi:hypothetical protein
MQRHYQLLAIPSVPMDIIVMVAIAYLEKTLDMPYQKLINALMVIIQTGNIALAPKNKFI